MANSEAALGQPAMSQILAKLQDKSDEERKELSKQLESNLKRFDKKGKGKLTVDEYYNVIKVQNKIDTSKDEIRKLAADLDMDKDFRISIKDFMTAPIISEEVFNKMDKNKDGFVSKGELKLAQRQIAMKDLGAIIDAIDINGDGKLTYEEVKAVLKQVGAKAKDNRKSAKESNEPKDSKSGSSSKPTSSSSGKESGKVTEKKKTKK